MNREKFNRKRIGLRFSRIEIKHLLLSWIFVSIIFYNAFNIPFFYSFITVGLGFILHELGHKFVAQHFHFIAEFRADFSMLFFSFLLSFLHFVFLAPGAVLILGNMDKRKNGIISLAGPLMNILLAGLFFGLMIFYKSPILGYGFMINAWLAMFNMLPFPMFDGKKVFSWNKSVYFTTLTISAILVMLYYL